MKVASLVCILLAVVFAAAENLPDKFFGTFDINRSVNFTEYWEAKGYGYTTRWRFITRAGVTKVITKTGDDTFNFDSLSTKKDLKYKDIKLGEEFIGEGWDGSNHTITFSFKDGVLYEKHVPTDMDAEQKEDEYRFHFEEDEYRFHFEEDELVQTLEYNGVIAKKYFKRI
ncbi:hypothetical protein PRIPAC_95272 [Pristionchus pacificus]|uniref:Uncharacterized protein n=1 Tax=Pristionchus pacificus TaxID=54126 RepID=A0A454Y391_PRIPA|nr:hypothetical protein PRIPAC_95272 [Pristionchus pacificus]|eukprot:PDM84081.1 hypothetical protein PRIPAC_34273 [Pristionchus pacificus]